MDRGITSTPIEPSYLNALLKEGKPVMASKSKAFLPNLARRLMSATINLWMGNCYLERRYYEAKQESATLYRLLAAVIQQSGGALRLDEQTWQATPEDQRIRGYALQGTSDTLFQLSNEQLLVSRAPQWLAPVLEGKTPPKEFLQGGDKKYLPIFDVTDHVRAVS